MFRLNISPRATAIILLGIIALSVFGINQVQAESKTIIVPDNQPTITAALAAANPGDTIYIKSGTYNEKFTIEKSISIKGENAATTIINGANSGTVILVKHDGVTISGVTVQYADTSTHSPYWLWSSRLAAIHLLSVKDCNITGNTLQNAGCAVWAYDTQSTIINGNVISGCDFGMRIDHSKNNTITDNHISDCYGGIFLLSAQANTLRRNIVGGNTQNFALQGSGLPDFLNHVDDSNTVDGKPVCYWIGRNGGIVPTNAGYVALINCADITVNGLHLSNNQDAVFMFNTRSVVVSDCTVAGVNTGVNAFNSEGGIVSGNTITANTAISVTGNGARIIGNTINTNGIGIAANGTYHTIAGNNIEGTSDYSYMIRCWASYTNITGNTFRGRSYTYATMDGDENVFYKNVMTDSYQLRATGNGNIIYANDVTGISVSDGSGNQVCGNRITNGLGLSVGGNHNAFYANQIQNNYYVGIDIGWGEAGSYSNTIYHNNIISNEKQVKNFIRNMANMWDNGAEGNYWSDYTGADANGDGFGDTPHVIKDEVFNQSQSGMIYTDVGQDNHPLVAPFNINSLHLELPEYVYVLPSASPEPTLTPAPTPPQPTPTATSQPTLTATPTQQTNPTETPTPTTTATPSLAPGDTQPEPEAFPAEIVLPIVGATAIAAAVAVAVLAWRRRLKRA
jgi:parallel beta-helix repeat protein